MVDRSKRKVLYSLGVAVAVPFMPRLAGATSNLPISQAGVSDTSEEQRMVASHETEFLISLNLDGSPTMSVTNISSKLQILRRIQPGVVRVGEKNFDLNQPLLGSAYAISAGATRRIAIVESSNSNSETVLAARYQNLPLRAASVMVNDVQWQNMEPVKVLVA